jgi:signal transduction histidine kinase
LSSIDINRRTDKSFWESSIFLFVIYVGAFAILLVLGKVSFNLLDKEIKASLLAKLQLALPGTVKMFKIWERDTASKSKVISLDKEVKKDISSLLEIAHSNPKKIEELLSSKPLRNLRDRLNRILPEYGFEGFIALDLDGFAFAASEDQAIGHKKLLEKAGSKFFKLSLLGNSAFALPFKSEVSLMDETGKLHKDAPTMLTSFPVYDEKGKVMAVLSFRLRPEAVFADIFEIERTGQSGEVYAFNSQGLFISKSRFREQLKEVRLLENHPEALSILNISIKDPGGNLFEGFRPKKEIDSLPFTRMAASALKGESGFDFKGYRDFRGVKVVGVWSWLSEFGFGVASEMNYDEAFSLYYKLEKWYWILFGSLIFASVISLVLAEKRRRYRYQLVRSKDEAEKANRAKSEFLAKMSHELRTPMNAILGFTQFMMKDKKEPLTEFQSSSADHILKAGNHLLELINEILDLSQIEAGKLKIKLEPVDLFSLTNEICDLMQPVGANHDVTVKNMISDDVPFLNADKMRLKQVLVNLISNGIKYNRKGGEVVLSMEEIESKKIRIKFRDTGYGVSKEQKKIMFQPFERVGAEAKKVDGAGIGLTITKYLVEMMEGHIDLESVVDKGSCFYVDIPIYEEVVV